MKYFYYAFRNLPSKPEEFCLPTDFYIPDQDQSPPSSSPVPRLQGSLSMCAHCDKGFETDQAKFGHMRIHQDRGESNTDHLLPNSWAATRKRVRKRKPVIVMNSPEAVTAAIILMEMSRSKSNDSSQNKKMTMESDLLDEKKHASENCNMSFPSDQALIDHRSSHKKERRKNEAIQKPTEVLKIGEVQKSRKRKRKRKVKSERWSHVCEVCNMSYLRGQQRGGHKRAHYKKDLSTVSELPNGQAALDA